MNLARRQPPTAGGVLPGLAYGRENSVAGPLDFPKVSLHMVEGPSSGALEWGSETMDGIKNFLPLVPVVAPAFGGLAQPAHAENGRQVPSEVDLYGCDADCIVSKTGDIKCVVKCNFKDVPDTVR